jgi:hypothetical protein
MYNDLQVEGDLKDSHSLQYHLDRCASILLLIELFLGDDVKPVAVAINGSMPIVTVEVEGFESCFHIWERQKQMKVAAHNPRGYEWKLTPIYVSDFNFGTYVDTVPGIVGGDTYTLCV